MNTGVQLNTRKNDFKSECIWWKRIISLLSNISIIIHEKSKDARVMNEAWFLVNNSIKRYIDFILAYQVVSGKSSWNLVLPKLDQNKSTKQFAMPISRGGKDKYWCIC